MAIENQQLASYTEFTTEIRHWHHEGVFASPVAGPGPQRMSLVQLHAQAEFMVVFWSGIREGAAPLVPSHKSFLTNLNRVFLGGFRDGLIEPTFGGHSYSLSGVWVFALSQPEGLDSNFNLSMCPWEAPSNTQGMMLADFMVPSANFVNGILVPTTAILQLPVDSNVQLLNNYLKNEAGNVGPGNSLRPRP